MAPYDSGQEQAVEPELDVDTDEYSDLEQVQNILDDYWAGTKDEKRLHTVLCDKAQDCYEAMDRRGFFQMMRLSYAMYYGLGTAGIGVESLETQCIQFEGEDGELVMFRVNEFRSLCDQIFNMTTKNRPAFQAQAINSDAVTLGQIEASDSIIKYYYEQVFGERKEKEVVKCEGLYGKGWTYLEWDPDGGPDIQIPVEAKESPLGPMEQPPQVVKAGRFLIQRLYPWQVICEPYRSEFEDHLWRQVIDHRSKWEMIARYPIFAKKIREQAYVKSTWSSFFPGYDQERGEDEDTVCVRVFLHVPCAALPKGRKAIFVGETMVFDDEDGLGIDTMPLIDFMSCELDGTSFGISDLWNLIPIQQVQDQLLSDMASIIEAHGRPAIAVVKGSDLDIDALANGAKVVGINSKDDLPVIIQPPTVPEISIKLVDLMRRLGQSLSGLNAISRGEADASVKSGTHAALYHAIAVEAQAPRQAALDLHRERVTNVILQFLKKYAKHPQLVAIAGEDERANLELFTASDIAHVHRVVIKTANPMMRTQAGRLQIAEMLRDWPGMPLKDPQQVIELITSGIFKPLTQPAHVQSIRVRRENALLAAAPPVQEVPGEPDPLTGMPAPPTKTVPTVPVFATDDHSSHINGHLEVLTSPDTLDNPAKMDAVFAHIMEHVTTWRDGDPGLAQLLGHMPPPQMGMPLDPNATSSGKKGPSDQDMSRVQADAAPPQAKPSMDQTDDSRGAFGRVPQPSEAPAMGG